MVGIFPDRAALIRLVGAVVAEQHDEWIEGRRCLGLELIQQSQPVGTAPAENKEQEDGNIDLALSAYQTKNHAATAIHHANGLDPQFTDDAARIRAADRLQRLKRSVVRFLEIERLPITVLCPKLRDSGRAA